MLGSSSALHVSTMVSSARWQTGSWLLVSLFYRYNTILSLPCVLLSIRYCSFPQRTDRYAELKPRSHDSHPLLSIAINALFKPTDTPFPSVCNICQCHLSVILWLFISCPSQTECLQKYLVPVFIPIPIHNFISMALNIKPYFHSCFGLVLLLYIGTTKTLMKESWW